MRMIEIREDSVDRLREVIDRGLKIFDKMLRELEDVSPSQMGQRNNYRNDGDYYGNRDDERYDDMVGERRRRDSLGRYR